MGGSRDHGTTWVLSMRVGLYIPTFERHLVAPRVLHFSAFIISVSVFTLHIALMVNNARSRKDVATDFLLP